MKCDEEVRRVTDNVPYHYFELPYYITSTYPAVLPNPKKEASKKQDKTQANVFE
jgi:hypothetical protein